MACWSANSCERLPSREGRRGSRRRRPEPERRSRRTPLGSPWSSSHHRGNRRCGSRCAPGRSPIPWTLDAPFWLLARPWLRRANLTRWDSRTTDRLLGRLLRGPFVGVPAGWSSVYADCEETEAGTQQADRPSPRTRDRWSTPSGCHGRIIAQVGHADGVVFLRASLRGNCLEPGVFGCVGRGRDQLGATLAGRRVVAVEGDCGKHPPGVDVRAA